MRIGITAAETGDAQALSTLTEQIRRAADDGFASVWVANIFGLEALTALAGAGGDLAYATASRGGALTVLAAVSSLYPVATIALGVMIRRLRPTRIQVAGIIIALIGTVVLGVATG